jgi:hypothetical protein
MISTHTREVAHLSTTMSDIPSATRKDPTEDVPMPSLNHAQGILESLRGLDRLDGRTLGLSFATNFAYWKLGRTYESFCDVG